mmetsp:Transcript_71680/g.113611  ORF Transcript_71680/g.113611 Transcript_71680/m.113611 type:complete len:261 (+) Transcript_71680:294-1076(+)
MASLLLEFITAKFPSAVAACFLAAGATLSVSFTTLMSNGMAPILAITARLSALVAKMDSKPVASSRVPGFWSFSSSKLGRIPPLREINITFLPCPPATSAWSKPAEVSLMLVDSSLRSLINLGTAPVAAPMADWLSSCSCASLASTAAASSRNSMRSNKLISGGMAPARVMLSCCSWPCASASSNSSAGSLASPWPPSSSATRRGSPSCWRMDVWLSMLFCARLHKALAASTRTRPRSWFRCCTKMGMAPAQATAICASG